MGQIEEDTLRKIIADRDKALEGREAVIREQNEALTKRDRLITQLTHQMTRRVCRCCEEERYVSDVDPEGLCPKCRFDCDETERIEREIRSDIDSELAEEEQDCETISSDNIPMTGDGNFSDCTHGVEGACTQCGEDARREAKDEEIERLNKEHNDWRKTHEILREDLDMPETASVCMMALSIKRERDALRDINLANRDLLEKWKETAENFNLLLKRTFAEEAS